MILCIPSSLCNCTSLLSYVIYYGLFISELLFWCPNLFGDTVVGSRDEIEQAIQNYLLSGSVCNTNEAIVLMVIRGIEKSKLPSSSNIPLSELPSLSEIKQNRKQNIVRILQNLISAPENPVYRRLRASNKLIQDLLSIDGFESFLTVIDYFYIYNYCFYFIMLLITIM